MVPLTALLGFLLLAGAPAVAEAPVKPIVPSYAVTLTAYNAVPEQTDDDPHITASGAFSNPEIIAARSVDLASALPFGTIIAIEGPREPNNSCGFRVVAPIVGYRVVADAMNAKFTERIDILFSTNANYTLSDGRVRNAGTVLGICSGATVKVVGRIDLLKQRMPKTQLELAALVEGKSELAVK